MIQRNINEIIKEGWKVDKAKIKYTMRKLEEIETILNNIGSDIRLTKYWESKDFKQCQKNFTLTTEEGTLYLGVGSNQQKINFNTQQKTLIIEYNPQKINLFKEFEYLKDLKNIDLHRKDIMYIDLAYDVYKPITELEYSKRRINEYECKISHEELETVYLRKLGSNGAVRIYNKTLEMNRGNDENIDLETGEVNQVKYIGDCTRYEIRIKPGEYSKHINITNPYLAEELIKLHEMNIKKSDLNENILKEIEKLDYAEFTNTLLIHNNYTERVPKNKRKHYKELYENIKKSCPNPRKNNQQLKAFTTNDAYTTLLQYLNGTTNQKDSQILIENL